MGRAGTLGTALWLALAGSSEQARAADPSSAAAASTEDEVAVNQADEGEDPLLDWWQAWAHAVRLDVAPGRSTGRDLGAGGLALQWEWWPTEHLAYTARTWMQHIRVPSSVEGARPAERQATGLSMGLQAGTPGKLKLIGGAGVGVAFVNGRLPPSDRWSLRPVPLAGVLEAHGGVVVMARPVTLHALAWVHLYSEGPAVLSLSFGGGPLLKPSRRQDDGTR